MGALPGTTAVLNYGRKLFVPEHLPDDALQGYCGLSFKLASTEKIPAGTGA